MPSQYRAARPIDRMLHWILTTVLCLFALNFVGQARPGLDVAKTNQYSVHVTDPNGTVLVDGYGSDTNEDSNYPSWLLENVAGLNLGPNNGTKLQKNKRSVRDTNNDRDNDDDNSDSDDGDSDDGDSDDDDDKNDNDDDNNRRVKQQASGGGGGGSGQSQADADLDERQQVVVAANRTGSAGGSLAGKTQEQDQRPRLFKMGLLIGR